MYVVSSLKWLISNVSYTLQPSDTPYTPPRNPGSPATAPAIHLCSRFLVCLAILIKA